MINFAEPSNLPPDILTELEATVPEYTVQFDELSAFSVTPRAHTYYEFTPRVDMNSKTPAFSSEAEWPTAHVVLAAPEEVSEIPLLHESIFYNRGDQGCTLWMTHPETPAEYVADAFRILCESQRKRYNHLANATDEKIINGLSKTRRRKEEAAFRIGQIADMVNRLEPYTQNQIAYGKEHLLRDDEVHQNRRRDKGVVMQTVDHTYAFSHDFKTTYDVLAESIRRSRLLCDRVFAVYSLEKFADHRSARHEGPLARFLKND